MGSESMSHERDIRYRVRMSNKPLGEGENCELIDILRMNLASKGWEKA